MSRIPRTTHRRWSTFATAGTLAIALGGVGLVGLATSAAAIADECVPADAHSYDESTYSKTVQAAESPGEGWTRGEEVVVVDEEAYDIEERKWRRWVGPRLLDFEHQWVPVWPHSTLAELRALEDAGWSRTLQTRSVTIPAVTHTEYAYTTVTDWLKESPGEGWTVTGTRTVNVPAVVCGVPSLKSDRSSQLRGGSLNLTALGFLGGENVDFVMHSTPVLLGTVAADGAGTASLAAVTIPSTAALGSHTVVATGQTSGRTASVSIEVVAAAPTAPAAPAAPTAFASTGAGIAAPLGTASALVLFGTALLALRRSRSASSV